MTYFTNSRDLKRSSLYMCMWTVLWFWNRTRRIERKNTNTVSYSLWTLVTFGRRRRTQNKHSTPQRSPLRGAAAVGCCPCGWGLAAYVVVVVVVSPERGGGEEVEGGEDNTKMVIQGTFKFLPFLRDNKVGVGRDGDSLCPLCPACLLSLVRGHDYFHCKHHQHKHYRHHYTARGVVIWRVLWWGCGGLRSGECNEEKGVVNGRGVRS